MQYQQKQKGLTILSWIFTLALLGLVGLAIIRLFPVYVEYFTIKASLETLVDEPRLQQMGNREIRSILLKQLNINAVEGIARENIEISRAHQASIVAINYEVRTSYLGNIDLVASFNPTVEVPFH